MKSAVGGMFAVPFAFVERVAQQREQDTKTSTGSPLLAPFTFFSRVMQQRREVKIGTHCYMCGGEKAVGPLLCDSCQLDESCAP